MRGASITADTIGDPKVSVREVSTWKGWGLVREHILFDTPPAQSEARHCSAPSPIGGKPEYQLFAVADAEGQGQRGVMERRRALRMRRHDKRHDVAPEVFTYARMDILTTWLICCPIGMGTSQSRVAEELINPFRITAPSSLSGERSGGPER